MLIGAMPAEWEETELRVPLALKSPPLDRATIQQRATAALRTAVQRAGDDGWEPTHPTDLAALEGLGRVERKFDRGFLGLGRQTTTYVAASVHLRRLKIDV
jgi:hypothetical protein